MGFKWGERYTSIRTLPNTALYSNHATSSQRDTTITFMLLLQCFCIIFQRISKKAFWFWHNYIQYIHNSGINIDNNLFSCFMWRHLQAFSTAKLHAATHILHVPLQTTSQGSEPIQAFTRSISDYYYSLCMQNRNRCTCINVHVLHQHCPLSCTFTKWKPYSKSICLLTEKIK